MRIVLASSSPRRKELLEKLDIPFEIKVIKTEERIDYQKDYYSASMDIAYQKAKVVFDTIKDDVIVIGSDTMVVNNGMIYGKPKNYQEAFDILKNMSNHQHEVISSLCLIIRKKGQIYQELTYDKCMVYVDELSDKDIDDWIKNHDVYTRAGGYAIQEGFGKYVSKIDGDYFSIVGLPIHKLWKLLSKYLDDEK